MNEVIVTGGRDYKFKNFVYEVLDFYHPDIIIQGGATGVDAFALAWAKDRKKKYYECKADWNKHGKAAGPIRNKEMLDTFPNATIIVFSGGRGTANMLAQAKKQKRNIIIVDDSEWHKKQEVVELVNSLPDLILE